MNVRLLIALMLSLVAEPTGGPPPGLAGRLLWLALTLVGLAAWGLGARLLLAAGARRGDPAETLVRRHNRLASTSSLLWLATYATLLFLGRWPDVTRHLCPTSLLLVDRALVLLPMLPIFFVATWGSYLSTAVLRRALEAQGRPPAAAGLGLRAHLAFEFRQTLLILLLPFVFVLGARDVVYLAAGRWLGEWVDATIVLAMLAVYVLSPLMLRLVWPTAPLPEGPLRDRLMIVARRSGTPPAEILVWRTGGVMVNACLAGVVHPLRYVFLTDILVEGFHPSQVEAVFGHELGHARFRHVPFFFLVAVGGVLILVLLAPLIERLAVREEVSAIVFFGLYWGVFFGILSRRFERQSDLLGARLVVCPGEFDPTACTVHHPGAPTDADAICPYQAWAFTSALSRIAALNGRPADARSWRHGSIAGRIACVSDMIGQPNDVRRQDRALRRFKLLFIVALVGLAGILVWAWRAGWFDELTAGRLS